MATPSLFIIQTEKQVTVNKMLHPFKETGILKTNATEGTEAASWGFIWIVKLDLERGKNQQTGIFPSDPCPIPSLK